MNFKGNNFLSIDQITNIDDIKKIFDLAKKFEDIYNRRKTSEILKGAVLGNLFFEASTRTRLSFGTAFNLLGGNVIETIDFSSSSISKGESISDTARVISGYVDIIVIRHPEEGAVNEFAKFSKVPVINAGDGVCEHPTQALIDLYTIYKEFGTDFISQTKNLSVALVGDLKFGRTVHSLCKILSLFQQTKFILISPSDLKLPANILNLIRSRGCEVIETDDFTNGVQNADIIYMTRLQKERISAINRQMEIPYSLNLEFYNKYCHNKPYIMHPLPIDSRRLFPEIQDDIKNHEKSLIFKQTDNGVLIRMALFSLILGIEDKISENIVIPSWYNTKNI